MQGKVTLTREQEQALADLGDMLTFGEGQVIAVLDDPQRISRLGDRKKLLLAIFIAAHSHVDSMSYLLKSGRTHSSEVVLRSVLESYVNAAYISIVNNNSHAANYMLTEESLKLKNYNDMQTYRSQHPGFNTENEKYSDEDIRSGIDEASKAVAEIKRIYPKAIAVSTKQKIAAIDKKFNNGRKKYRPLEWSYFHTYHLLCRSTHVSFNGLFSLFTREENSLTFYIGGNPKRVSLLTLSAYSLYLDMLNVFLPRFGGEITDTRQFDAPLKRIEELV